MNPKIVLYAIVGITLFLTMSAVLKSAAVETAAWRGCQLVGACQPAVYRDAKRGVYLSVSNPTRVGGLVYVRLTNRSFFGLSCRVKVGDVESINSIPYGQTHTLSERSDSNAVQILSCQ